MIARGRAGLPRIALIGYGAIADEVIRGLEARGEISALVGILVRPERLVQLTRGWSREAAASIRVRWLQAARDSA